MTRTALAAQVHRALVGRAETVAAAESLTGGALSDLLSLTPGASATFVGGVVTYATELKQSLLGVPDTVVEAHGVVSAQCAEAMATGARALTGADWALSTTGVAGPTGQEGKPPGTVYLGLAGPGGTRTTRLALAGDRREIREQTCRAALRLLLDQLGHQ